jgi:hypothetical protein
MGEPDRHSPTASTGWDNFLYGFKGAQGAPDLGRQHVLTRRGATAGLTPARRDSPPGQLVGVNRGGSSHAGRLVPLLGPPGHGGVGAHQTPAADCAS